MNAISQKLEKSEETVNLQDSRYYLNRELSWLRFNDRVLHEATDPRTPLLERLKFAAIFSSNLDEFFMVLISGLMEQIEAGVYTQNPDVFFHQERSLRLYASTCWVRSKNSIISSNPNFARRWPG